MTPTDGGDDGPTEEEGIDDVPVAGVVGQTAAQIQACIHSRHHALQARRSADTA